MLEFICPSCRKRVQGDDSFAGKHVVCPGCGMPVTLRRADADATGITDSLPAFPATNHPPPDDAPIPSLAKAPHIFRRLAPFVIVIAICVTAVGLLVPSVEKVRTPATRTQTVNNLKQIGLAMQTFHDNFKRLPFNGTVPAVAKDEKSGSWAFQLLPFVDQQALFNDPNIKGASVWCYCCPKRGRVTNCTTGPWTDFCINPWLNDPDKGDDDLLDRRLTLLGITDGTSNTIFAGIGAIDPNLYGSIEPIPQSTDIFKGGAPALARSSTINRQDKRGDGALHWGSAFNDGTLFVFCDGTVRMIPYTISGGVIRNGVGDQGLAPFLTPAGNEKAELPD